MVLQKPERRWETKPLQCWEKAKELRRKFYQDEKGAKDKGMLLVDGFDSSCLGGVGNCHMVFYNPLGASIVAASNEFSRQCMAECEIRGYGRDFCGYVRNSLGAMFLNRGLLGGEFPPRDLVIALAGGCDAHNRPPQLISEHYNVPLFAMDLTAYYAPRDDVERDEIRRQYMIEQTLEQIEWLEKVTGREFDDEAFAEVGRNGLQIQAIAGETLHLNQNIPAPLDQKSIYSIFTLGMLVRSEQEETIAFWEMLRDEVKDRVANKIAAVGTERYRYMEEQPPPWYYLKYYRYLERYGAVCIGSPYTQSIAGIQWGWQEDGTYRPNKNPWELGWPFDSRENTVRALVQFWGGGTGFGRHGVAHEVTSKRLVDMARVYHCNGAILGLWRAAPGYTFGMREAALELIKAGIPTMHYEGAQYGDKTDFDEAQMLDRLDVFMETQGLGKLED
ncbi:MAG: 2-hydroxyacyl-CoA dehydratase family protein [Dehalococcoidia bacterium]